MFDMELPKDLPKTQEDREVYLRDHKAGGVVDVLRDGGVVEIEPDASWWPNDLYVAISYARAEGASITIVMEPRNQ